MTSNADLMKTLQTIVADGAERGQQLDHIAIRVDENYRTLRGHNGEPGLVADMNQMKSDMDEVKKICKENGVKVKPEPEHKSGVLTFEWLVNKALLPVAIGALMYVVLDLLPKLVEALAVSP